MILYHYTSAKHLSLIRRSGISKGAIPWKLDEQGGVQLLRGYQWLTLNSDFDQPWAVPSIFSRLPFRRNEYKIVIDIPQFQINRIINWADFCSRHNPDSADYLNSLGDPRFWKLFHGTIPPKWFIAIEKNPSPINLQFNEE